MKVAILLIVAIAARIEAYGEVYDVNLDSCPLTEGGFYRDRACVEKLYKAACLERTNEEYTTCIECQPDSKHPNGPVMCIRSCNPGCKCTPGNLRNDEGACVPKPRPSSFPRLG